MRKLRKTAVLLMMAFILSFTAVTVQDVRAAAEKSTNTNQRLTVHKNALLMISGRTYTLKAKKYNISGKVTWKSSNSKIASVNSKGKITAKKAGLTDITAKCGKYTAVCKVRVVNAKLNKTNLSITKGKTTTLKVTGTNRKVTWKSSNSKVVSVNSKGKLTAKKAGTAKITAAIGVSKITCNVTVTYTKWDKLLDQYIDDDSTNQLVFVKYTGGTMAQVEMYQKENGKWKRILKCSGCVGLNGIDKVRQGDKKTPTGTFTLTSSFGIKADPGSKLPYVRVDKNMYWCGDSHYYNQLIDIRKYPHNCTGEHLIEFEGHYDYGMFLDFNKENVLNKGAAIFLHCVNGRWYTAGCVAVAKENMIKIIRNAEKGAKICIYPNA